MSAHSVLPVLVDQIASENDPRGDLPRWQPLSSPVLP
jgi:hypothetical protein